MEKQMIKLKVEYSNQANTYAANDKTVKKIVQDVETLQNKNVYELILDDFLKQEQTLKNRILNRRSKKQTFQEQSSDSKVIDANTSGTFQLSDRPVNHAKKESLSINIDDYKEASDENRKISISISENENSENYTKKLTFGEELCKKDLGYADGFLPGQPSKSKPLAEHIRLQVANFNNEIDEYFLKHVFQRFAESIQRIVDEKFKKYAETCKIYQTQIKEMEFLLSDDDQHSESIGVIIESLKEEKQIEIDRMESHYDNIVQEAVQSFKTYGISNNAGIQLIEEKFKLDMFNLINDYLVPSFRQNKVKGMA